MASKQLGKLRQWAGEVISSRDKTAFTDEFRDLETDIDLRKEGATRLLAASEGYLNILSKKKESEALNDDAKILPIDAFGVVMLVHGEDFGQDSLYGASLVKMGKAHCKIATIQEAYALTFKDTFLSSIQKFMERIKEYDQHRKKLDSRRLSYDAAVAKFDKLKGGKKEKERKEAEEEMERAKQRFEDTEEEVRGQMHEIQEEEISQHRQLSDLLDIEINYVNQYLEVLRDVKLEWNDAADVGHKTRPRSRAPSLLRSKSRSNSVHSKKSAHSEGGYGSDDTSETEGVQRQTLKRRPSKPESVASRPPSRPASRLSMRKRADSNVAAPSDKETDKEKSEGSKSEKSAGRRLSVTGWASNAVGSMASLGKKSKDKDKFSALQEDENDNGPHTLTRSTSTHSMSGIISQIRNKTRDTPISSTKVTPRILKPQSLQEKKFVRALYDFAGASDELAFKAGDEILVVNEVLDDWWMGEINGKTGLFPTGYVEVIASKKPAAPVMPPKKPRKNSVSSMKQRQPSEDALNGGESTDGYNSRDGDDDDDDNDFSVPLVTPRHSPFYGVPSDTASITSSNADDDLHFQTSNNLAAIMAEGKKLAPIPIPQPIFRSATNDTTSSTGTKKAPPPPPPRRTLINPGNPPAVPDRPVRPIINRSLSTSSSSLKTSSTPPSSVEGKDHDISPFESASELTIGTNTNTASASGCKEFKQNPFKPQGMCNNCFSYH